MTETTALRTATTITRLSPAAAEELWVIDATALLFRAYYGMPARLSPTGGHVGAVLGLGHFLRGILRRRPAFVAIVHDAGQRTFRNRIDPRYKANRGDPPPDLAPQFDLARAFTEVAGLLTFSVPDYEADDLMATLARRAREEGLATRLFSGDKDLCQLVRDDAPRVVIEDPRTGEVYDADGVVRRVGVAPGRCVDFFALTGDTTDNVPGVPGVVRRRRSRWSTRSGISIGCTRISPAWRRCRCAARGRSRSASRRGATRPFWRARWSGSTTTCRSARRCCAARRAGAAPGRTQTRSSRRSAARGRSVACAGCRRRRERQPLRDGVG